MFYHEDEEQQIEILPIGNLPGILKQAEEIYEFSEARRIGNSFTDIFIREDAEKRISELKITVEQLERFLGKSGLPRQDKITTGIRPGEFNCQNTLAYGDDHSAFIVHYEKEIVQGFWILNPHFLPIPSCLEILSEIGQKWKLLLVDWYALEIIDLSNRKQIEQYSQFIQERKG